MKIEWNKENPHMKFHGLNQWDEEITKKMCRYYAPAINLKYNCWILITEDDLKIIAKNDPYNKWKKQWWKVGWYWKDWVEQVYKYVKENAEDRGWKIPNLIEFGSLDRAEMNQWLARWYAISIWIKFNSKFYKDVKDDKKVNNFEDYAEYLWKSWHFTNIAKWIRENAHDMIIDSYFDRRWSTYKVNISKLLNKLTMRTKYMFF